MDATDKGSAHPVPYSEQVASQDDQSRDGQEPLGRGPSVLYKGIREDSPEYAKRWQARAQILSSDGAWEDVPSSDEETKQMTTGASTQRAPKYADTDAPRGSPVLSSNGSHTAASSRDDLWEDEDAYGSDSDNSGQSSATEAPVKDALASESATAQQAFQVQRSQMNSNQRAMYDYKQSRIALMNTRSDNMARYKEVVGGGGAGSEAQAIRDESRNASNHNRRPSTADRLESVDPFTVGDTTESFDEADASGRAYEVRLPPQPDSVNTLPKNATLSERYRGASQPNGVANGTDEATSGPNEGQRRFASEEYASEPPSPAEETSNNSDWHTSTDASMDASGADNMPPSSAAQEARDVAEESMSTSIPNTPRVSSGAPQITISPSEETRRPSISPSVKSRRPSATPATRGGTPEMITLQLDQLAEAAPPMTLWEYLKEEVTATDFDSSQELKWERVTNFIAIPFHMEKIMLFGFLVCLDSFLYTFTILPLRFVIALIAWLRNVAVWATGGQKRYLHSAHKCDILKALLIVASCWMLSRMTDASKMYHSVRGQDVIKLYVIFNVLEIADRLCCSFGQDLLDSLFSRVTLARRKDGRQPYLRPLGFFALSLCYVFAHTLVLLYQLVTLNVAINSYDNALLTLLLSNQFVEIKGSVFKKFEKENLFQLTCADIVERFQLTLMLCSIGLRNLIEMAGAAGNSVAVVHSADSALSSLKDAARSPTNENGTASVASSLASSSLSALATLGALPTSFTVFPSFSLLETILTPVCIVLASECLVDWLKHAFITKFNHIRPTVYGRFMDVLCRDLVVAGSSTQSSSRRRKHAFVDQSPVVSRRLGFAAVPLACLLVRMASQIMSMLEDDSHYDDFSSPEWDQRLAPSTAHSMTVASIITAWHFVRRPLIILARPLIEDPALQLDNALAFLGRAMAWILTGIVTWVFLVAFKLVLGTNLVSFASRRFASLAEREREEEMNARGRSPIGVDKDERAYEAKIGPLLDKPDDDATRLAFSGQPIKSPSVHDGGKERKTSSLMDVSRYTMVRSRIW